MTDVGFHGDSVEFLVTTTVVISSVPNPLSSQHFLRFVRKPKAIVVFQIATRYGLGNLLNVLIVYCNTLVQRASAETRETIL